MQVFRKLLFWAHWIGGVLAGIVILIMSVTGVLLTYERQMIAWSDREYRVAPPSPNARPLAPGAILAKLKEREKRTPESLTWEAEAMAPVAVSFGRETVYVNPYTGEFLGQPTTGMREFMSTMRAWHRWLATTGENRAMGKAITGASNVVFLFLVVSGIYLWMPRVWRWQHVKAVTLFRGGLRGKARDFNWHNVAGFWAATPLFFVVLSAVVISYPGISQFIIELADGRSAGVSATGAGATGPTGVRSPSGSPQGPGPRDARAVSRVNPAQADAAFAVAFAETGWKTLTLRFPANPDGPFTSIVSRGAGGQPQLRETLSIQVAAIAADASSAGALRAEVVQRETFESQSLGRRIRMWMRFVHTGEYYGVVGQTIAGFATAAGVLLVYTGFALAFRRFLAWRKRQSSPPMVTNQEKAA